MDLYPLTRIASSDATRPLPASGRAIAYGDVQYRICSLPSSCPALGRASTSYFVPARKTWMAGTSPAMTMPKQRRQSADSLYAIALPASGRRGSERPTLVAGNDAFHGIDILARRSQDGETKRTTCCDDRDDGFREEINPSYASRATSIRHLSITCRPRLRPRRGRRLRTGWRRRRRSISVPPGRPRRCRSPRARH